MKFRVFLLVSVLFLSATADLQAPEVQTRLGRLKGQYVSVKGKEAGVHSFLGIPFAKPPLGPTLRLAAPQPAEGWQGLRDATKQPNMCIQDMDFVDILFEKLSGMKTETPDISEDCLYLNIYTPANRAPDAKLPVMVWIHGGGFSIGSASMFDGSALAAYQDVVVVLIQYRLGLLGFFSTGDEHVSGNFGLLDQIQALKWVKEHIHNFGGNQDLVTIFGESAGGVSVSLLLLSPLSHGLFQHAIAESGTASMDAVFMHYPVPVMQATANASGCSLESSEKIAKCMRNLGIDTILTLGKDPNLRFVVSIDGHFLTKPVPELLRKHELLTIPLMTGVNDHEGGFVLPDQLAPANWTEGMDREQLANMLFFFYPMLEDGPIREFILNEYVGGGEDRIRNRDGMTELLGDFFFNIPVIKIANAHRDAGAAVYLYEYHHAPKFLQKRRPSFVKSDHADEIFSVLGSCFTTTHVKLMEPCPEEEKVLSKIMMSYWGNFARTGSPNGDGLVNWPKYGAEEKHLSIDLKEQVAVQWLRKDRFIFVTQTLEKKIQQHRKDVENNKSPEVQTRLGRLKGQYVSVKGKEAGVHAFLGIPFAKPPLGPTLRLAAPQPAEGWQGLRDATKQPNMCIQNMDFVDKLLEKLKGLILEIPDISEDCLYLNIYTPANRAPDAKLPVMVWIHGGGFLLGSASAYDGSALAAYQDVVVVLIQYRLGVLGFVSTGDEHLPGNFGLLDQIQALKWVKENIHSFGGNPDLVTIFGESAGGVSVSLLLLSPLSDGLFHRAIAESGTAAMDLLVINDPVPAMQAVANASGCSLESTEKIAECMRNLDSDTILAVGKDQSLRYPVNVDGHFLTEPVPELFQKHKLLTVPFMTGINNHEGGFVLSDHYAPPNWTEGMDQELVRNILFAFYPLPEQAVIRDLIVNEYTGSGEDRIRNRDGFTELLGDFFFTIPAIKAANAHRDAGAAVYLYEYHHAPTILQKIRPSFVKCDHSDEILTVLGLCFTTTHVKLADACPKEEEQFSRIMMNYWGNFARTGSPNGHGLVKWPKYGAEERYLSLDLKEQVSGQSLRKNRFTFVTQTLPEKIKKLQENAEHSELALAAYQDVVVVLIQYRLGVLGFLSTGDEHMPGNFGLLDQIQALKWVKENIHSFGGNPDLVTIFGVSAGGISVSLLLLSPLSDGLFHRAIAQSGTAAMDVLMNDPVPVMQAVANASGCSLESTEKIAICMRNLDTDTILAWKDPFMRYPIHVDGHFLTEPVPELLQKHKLLTVPFIIGVNNHEGGFVVGDHFAPPNWTEGMDREQVVDLVSIFYPLAQVAAIGDLIVTTYVGSGENRIRNRDGYTEFIGDFLFSTPAVKVVNAHRDAGADVFLYEYHHAPKFQKKRRPSFVKCDHLDEVFMVQGYCFTTTHAKLADACPEEEEEFSKIMMNYWGNFARTGSPNGDGLVNWPKYGEEEKYLSLDLKEQVSGHSLKKDRFVFLTQTLPEKIKKLEEKVEHSEL